MITEGSLAYYDSEALSNALGTIALNATTVINKSAGDDGYFLNIINGKVSLDYITFALLSLVLIILNQFQDTLKMTLPSETRMEEWSQHIKKATVA